VNARGRRLGADAHKLHFSQNSAKPPDFLAAKCLMDIRRIRRRPKSDLNALLLIVFLLASLVSKRLPQLPSSPARDALPYVPRIPYTCKEVLTNIREVVEEVYI